MNSGWKGPLPKLRFQLRESTLLYHYHHEVYMAACDGKSLTLQRPECLKTIG